MNETQASPASPSITGQQKEMAMPCREKYWEERTDSEKIAALRETVAWMARDLVAANRVILELAQHQHAPDGSMVAPLHVRLGSMNEQTGYERDYARTLRTQRERRE